MGFIPKKETDTRECAPLKEHAHEPRPSARNHELPPATIEMFRPETKKAALVSRGGLHIRRTTMGVTASPRTLQLHRVGREKMENARVSACQASWCRRPGDPVRRRGSILDGAEGHHECSLKRTTTALRLRLQQKVHPSIKKLGVDLALTPVAGDFHAPRRGPGRLSSSSPAVR